MGLTESVAKFITTAKYEDFPEKAVFAARHGVIDCVACALAGSKEELANILVGFAEETGSGNAATIIGRGAQLSYLLWPTKRRWSNRNFGHVLGLPPDHPRVRRIAYVGSTRRFHDSPDDS